MTRKPIGISVPYRKTNDDKTKWVGLTDEEISKLQHLIDWTAHWSYGTFARAIEAKLKEKNK